MKDGGGRDGGNGREKKQCDEQAEMEGLNEESL